MKMCQLVTGEERHELDMVFSFDHLEMPGHVRFEINDVEAKGYFSELSKQFGEQKAFEIILSGTREHTRVLLPWNEAVKGMKASMQKKISQEIMGSYKQLITMRKSDKALVYGDFEVLNQKKNRFVYKRSLDKAEFIVDCNLSKVEVAAHNVSIQNGYTLVFSAEECVNQKVLKAYEARIWRKSM